VPEDEHAPADKAGNPIYFRFELFENQRWWMGLDWTSALLPQERPSWCDVHLLPVSPPMAFTLPPSSSIDVPAPTDTEPRAQVRRTATWRWIDDDWTVYKRTGDGATVSPARPAFDDDLTPAVTASPDKARPASVFGTSPDDDGGHARAPSMAEAAFAKGLGRLKNVASTATSTSPSRPAAVRGRTGSGSGSSDAEAPPPSLEDVLAGAAPAPVGQAADRNEPTDGDGWVYGDNRWENMGSKGGLGKVSQEPGKREGGRLTLQFTRRRRWQRRAVCTETVHRIKELAATDATPTATPAPAAAASTTSLGHGSPDGATMQRTASGRAPFKPPTQPTEPSVVCKSVETRPPAAPAAAPIPTQAGASAVPTRDEQLRQRLKKAMGSMGA
jgi:hypothetical protein